MKYFVIFLILVGLVCFIIPQSFAEQPQYGKEVSTYLFDYEKKPKELDCNFIKPTYNNGQLIQELSMGPENFEEKMGKFLLEFTNSPTNSKEINLKIELLDKQNKTIPHVGFFINVTKQDEVISPIFFHAHSGTLKIALNQSDSASDWSAEGKLEPYAGGLESENDSFVVMTPVLSQGNYHFEIIGFSAYDDKSIFTPQCAPKFDWSLAIDKFGRAEIVTDSKSSRNSSIIYDPPLKQFKSGIPPYEIKCKENLVLIEKYDGSMACVKPETKTRLMEQGWTFYTIKANQNTIPEITKNQIIDIVRSDMVERVENPERIDFYPDTPSNNTETYFGLYYIDDKGTPFRVSNLDYAIAQCKTLEAFVCGALNPSIIDSITGKLVYDVEVTYHNDDGSLTAFYYVVDAKNGQILYDGQNLR